MISELGEIRARAITASHLSDDRRERFAAMLTLQM